MRKWSPPSNIAPVHGLRAGLNGFLLLSQAGT
jgi:hypothetical protein